MGERLVGGDVGLGVVYYQLAWLGWLAGWEGE
jgi:hypothetical protein